MDCKAFFAAALVLAASTSAGLAETLSDEEILNRFLIQRDAYAAVKSGKGATRGLKIVTVEEVTGATAATTETATTETAATDTTATDTTTTTETEVATTETTSETTGTEVVAVDTTTETTTEATGEAKVELAAAEVGILPDELQVNVRISFDYDSATIKADQQPILDQMCRVITASDIKLFRIMGHTDSAGSDAYNEQLSLARAEEVKRRLVSDCGIDASRLEPMGLGERFLADPADPAAAENRRVEFQALS